MHLLVALKLLYLLKILAFLFDSKCDTDALAERINNASVLLKSVNIMCLKKLHSKLFSLSKLQSLLSKVYKIHLQQILDIIQKLYEKGYVSYPRTNTEYLTETEKNKLRELTAIINALGYQLEFNDNKFVSDNFKILNR